jgi:AAA15 family ATPase/GTPase
MKDTVVSLQKIELKDFKNVAKGTITYNKTTDKSNFKHVLGIYGQNGSGKTSVIDGLYVFKEIVSGRKLTKDIINYISADKNSASLYFEYLITHKDELFKAFYNLEIEKIEEESNENDSKSDNRSTIQIKSEKLSYSKLQDGQWTSRVTIIDYEESFKDVVFKPKTRYQDIITVNKDNDIQFKVAKEMSKELCTSFIFNKKTKSILEKGFIKNKDYITIINSLYIFAELNLFVIKNDELGVINTNQIMPFSFRLEEGKEWYSGNLAVRLFSISFIDKEKFNVLNRVIDQINVVINAIIPELNIKLRNYGLETSENGKEGFRVELISSRKNIDIPLKYESDGVKKIVSILSALIAMYNNEQILLAIDELDAGIYEFLLGEILEVVSEHAKGQFIFTSHNLRALEKLDKDCIVFTTTNPNNRYITMGNVKNTNNLRDVYLKSILLGGQKETIYESSNKFEISYAFKKAWKR